MQNWRCLRGGAAWLDSAYKSGITTALTMS